MPPRTILSGRLTIDLDNIKNDDIIIWFRSPRNAIIDFHLSKEEVLNFIKALKEIKCQ